MLLLRRCQQQLNSLRPTVKARDSFLSCEVAPCSISNARSSTCTTLTTQQSRAPSCAFLRLCSTRTTVQWLVLRRIGRRLGTRLCCATREGRLDVFAFGSEPWQGHGGGQHDGHDEDGITISSVQLLLRAVVSLPPGFGNVRSLAWNVDDSLVLGDGVHLGLTPADSLMSEWGPINPTDLPPAPLQASPLAVLPWLSPHVTQGGGGGGGGGAAWAEAAGKATGRMTSTAAAEGP